MIAFGLFVLFTFTFILTLFLYRVNRDGADFSEDKLIEEGNWLVFEPLFKLMLTRKHSIPFNILTFCPQTNWPKSRVSFTPFEQLLALEHVQLVKEILGSVDFKFEFLTKKFVYFKFNIIINNNNKNT